MHYYKRHLGDYARDTGHLTALEHGIYTLLLDWYYVNERPIPPDKAVRIARGNPQETQTVLEEFFELTENGWMHARAEREIAAYNARAEKNREVGKLGGRPPKTQTVSERNPQETLTINHKPLKSLNATVQPTAARFDEFWAAYPNRNGKATALAKWKKKKLDSRADEIIAHVRKMLDQDDGWQRGFAPMGSTYINQERWTDEPKGPPNATGSPLRPAKTNPGGSSPRKEETPQSRLEAAESYARDMVRLGQMTSSEAAEYVARYRKKCEVENEMGTY